MGARRTTFGKLERERAKKAKAAAKRERRQRLGEATPDADTPATETAEDDHLGELSAADLLKLVERTHQEFEAGDIGYEEFEERKAELLARLPIE